MNTPKYKLKSFDSIYLINSKSGVQYWFYGILILMLLIMFLPWTQNIKANGDVTTLFQEQRPQNINSPIPGKIAKWWVKEGDFVQKGDTILKLTEIKESYLDPNLIGRTMEQVDAKKGAVRYYIEKVTTTKSQINALQKAKLLKIEQLNNKLGQLQNKLTGEKAELEAIGNELKLVQNQFERQQKMFDEGLVSQTELQKRNANYQNTQAKQISSVNKVAQTEQEILNIKIEQNTTEQEYSEKISKAEGDRFQSMSNIEAGKGDIAKLENQAANYIIRNGMYYVLAPQDGQIVQANKSGIGEIVKEGETITVIVPKQANYAVEMYVRPMDLPLIDSGQLVRLMFDGFPSIIFSGWPNNSYGTFEGKVIAYENTISTNGMFRVLVTEDVSERSWPEQIKLGTGAEGIALLKDVPIWYELWRNINGFPPDYYKLKEPKQGDSQNKK